MDFIEFSEWVDRVSEATSDTNPVKKGILHGIRHKMDPTHPKTFPKQPLDGPSGFQDIPGRPQNAPKTIPRPPKTIPRRPKIPQDGPKSHQGLPKTPCDHPKKLLRSHTKGPGDAENTPNSPRRPWSHLDLDFSVS